MKTVFRLIGVFELGKRNALKIEKSNLTFHFPDLPRAFDGYRILFFADLHLDGLEGLTDKVLSLVRGIRADLCIIGGDFRMETHGPFEKAVVHLRRVISEIRASDGVFGVLGNHDCLEIIEQLECDGIRFLVNDSCAVERNGEKIWLVGVDDPHYYRCHDLEQAFDNVPRGAFSILIAHSNEIYREASRYRPQLYLCGHTHAGQIQLPVVGPVFTHSKAPRSLSGGRWTHGDMLGYTTCGVGVSGVPVRFFSKGEVALITLARAPSADERDRIS